MENKENTKIKMDIEAKTISDIAEILSTIPEERRIAVLDFVRGRITGSGVVILEAKESFSVVSSNEEKQSIKEFLKRKSPQNLYQHAIVLAYFLRKFRKIDEVNKGILEKANTEALGRTIDNWSSVLNDAMRKYGYFIKGSGGKKKLSAFGEDIVNALPDQDRVKGLAQGRPKKRKVGKRKTKKI